MVTELIIMPAFLHLKILNSAIYVTQYLGTILLPCSTFHLTQFMKLIFHLVTLGIKLSIYTPSFIKIRWFTAARKSGK